MEVRVYVVTLGRNRLVLRWQDPLTRRWKQKAAGTTDRREAERQAGQLRAELQEHRYVPPNRLTWAEFRERYETEHLASLAASTVGSATSALNHVENHLRPHLLRHVDSDAISRLQALLRGTGIKETSIATHLRHLRAALSWGKSLGLLHEVPSFQMPKRAKGKSPMRGRPITAEEFERMLAVVPEVRPLDAETWQHYLTGLWLSGLRLSESLVVGWEQDAPIAVDLSGRYPRLRIWAEAEKGHRDRLLPITPDFAEFLLKTSEHERRGRVFRIDGLQTGGAMTDKRVGRIVTAIGKKAGVVVNKADEKFASAHDLRRAYGTRWASKVKPATLQLLMRHESIETTLKYYVAQDADEVAQELWRLEGGRIMHTSFTQNHFQEQ